MRRSRGLSGWFLLQHGRASPFRSTGRCGLPGRQNIKRGVIVRVRTKSTGQADKVGLGFPVILVHMSADMAALAGIGSWYQYQLSSLAI